MTSHGKHHLTTQTQCSPTMAMLMDFKTILGRGGGEFPVVVSPPHRILAKNYLIVEHDIKT